MEAFMTRFSKLMNEYPQSFASHFQMFCRIQFSENAEHFLLFFSLLNKNLTLQIPKNTTSDNET